MLIDKLLWLIGSPPVIVLLAFMFLAVWIIPFFTKGKKRKSELLIPSIVVVRPLLGKKKWQKWILPSACALLGLLIVGGVWNSSGAVKKIETRTTTVEVETRAIVGVFDISGSMSTIWEGTTRYGQTRSSFLDLVEKRQEDLFGLILFSTEASVVRDLTTKETRQQLFDALPEDFSNSYLSGLSSGTEISEGLREARIFLSGSGENPTGSKIVVLASDMEDYDFSAIALALRALLNDGVRVYILALPSDFTAYQNFPSGVTDIPQVFTKQIFERYFSPQDAVRYFEITDPKSVDKAVAEIDAIERGPISVTKTEVVTTDENERWIYATAMGTLCGLILLRVFYLHPMP